ncbi:helix-turn-helix domain-containing protein [Patescibacteria group bacterium]|nr:helix-turn-helix domain-containing protein [Patescibacteria group bacterium]MBU0776774.1 helix-turn-helix domain-containing protein [Patescibacteria group bacterium]MBU0846347.1 helix-turn-helix domain-containing protein [Patescibacteria group bacterium]MBU0922693.1 helix-turn-helix domain-containing protein [Patescibacteria group bacterium]MBU1066744.1 helix-turn-helix domain-containing protein [Patescibacteria group bacterium]
MKTIGIFIKEARIKKRFSQDKIAKETKIKEEFVVSIEKENWETLPEYPVVIGFVKKISKYLKLDERQAVAFLRRDYPPRVLPVNPKPDVAKKFVWSPKLTFVIGIAVIAIAVLGYLGFQYSSFVSPPKLVVDEPQEEQVIKQKNLIVSGKTDQDATIKINNQPILVEEDGSFKAEIEIFEGTEEIVVKAVSRSGKETTIRRKIYPDLE